MKNIKKEAIKTFEEVKELMPVRFQKVGKLFIYLLPVLLAIEVIQYYSNNFYLNFILKLFTIAIVFVWMVYLVYFLFLLIAGIIRETKNC